MYNTTKGMIENFQSMIKSFGHIPNGNRYNFYSSTIVLEIPFILQGLLHKAVPAPPIHPDGLGLSQYHK